MKHSRRAVVGLAAAAIGAPVLGRAALAQSATPAATPAAAASLNIYLLTIPGTLAPATTEDARALHNSTAGAPASIAAAKSLGDISHMVYVPTTPAASGPGDVLFMDLWTSADGLNAFFANPQVQKQAAEIFAKRDPVVWESAAGFSRYAIPAPQGMNDRVIALVRASISDRAKAMAVHNTIVAGGVAAARAAGTLSHDAYFRLPAPGEAQPADFLAVDVWMSADGANAYYANPAFQSATASLFDAAPVVTMWTYPSAVWTEW